jgi:hypothetical protein
LKFIILRVVLQLFKLYHKEVFSEAVEKRRIEGVTGVFSGKSSAAVSAAARRAFSPAALRGRDALATAGRMPALQN